MIVERLAGDVRASEVSDERFRNERERRGDKAIEYTHGFSFSWPGETLAQRIFQKQKNLNVTGRETRGFLIAAIALILSASAVQSLPFVGGVLTSIVGNVVTFVSAAVLVVALKSVFEVTKS